MEFCDDYLAYLADSYQITILNKNREVNVYENPLDKKIHQELDDFLLIEIRIIKPDSSIFFWNEIKDHIIPFLNFFSKRYKTKHITLREKQLLGYIYRQYKIEDIIKDKLENKKIVELIIDLY
jgi:hypothetical protein